MLSRFAAAASIALVAVAAPLHAQLINGGFETPVAPVGAYTGYNTGDTFGGWTVVGATGNIALISSTFTQSGFSFPSHGGSQWLDLTGTSNSPTGVQQVFATAAGQSYDLSFWVGNTSGYIFGVTSTVDVMLNGSLFMAAVNATPGTTQTWQQFTTTFTATAPTTTLAFINGDPSSDTENGLDDIVVSQSVGVPTTSTPEPASIALIATGLAGLVPIVRKRRR